MTSTWQSELLSLIDGVESHLPDNASDKARRLLESFRDQVRTTRGRRYQRRLEHDIDHCFRTHQEFKKPRQQHVIGQWKDLLDELRQLERELQGVLDSNRCRKNPTRR